MCGYITQLIDHLDTSVFFAQLDAFYAEFLEKSNAGYNEFSTLVQNLSSEFTAYVASLTESVTENSAAAYQNMASDMEALYQSYSDQSSSLYSNYNDSLAAYLQELKGQGEDGLAAITEQLIAFRNENEAAFLEWFENIKDQLGDDAAGGLQLQVDSSNELIGDLETMLYTGMVRVRLYDDDGGCITDSLGNPLLVGWPICKCNQ